MWGRKKRGKEDFPRKKNQEGRGKNKREGISEDRGNTNLEFRYRHQ